MATTQQRALQAKTIVPGLTVDDLAQSITFYEALGFSIADRWEHDGQLVGVMLQAGASMIGLSQDDWKKGRNRQKGVGARLHIETTQQVDEIASRAKSAGVTLDTEPHDTDWNTRQFEVTDPTGFKLTISSEWRRP